MTFYSNYFSLRKDYDSDQNTDEPIESFKRSPWLIAEFEAGEALMRGVRIDFTQQLNKLPLHRMKRRDQVDPDKRNKEKKASK